MIGVLVGRLRKPAGRYITETGEAHLKSLGSEVIGQVGHVHNPLLERYIGQKVVVELLEDDEVHEHVGIFKNYSADFLEFLDVQFPQRQALPLGSDLRADTPWVSATRKGNLIQVVNHTGQPVLLQSLALINEGEEDEEDLLNVVVDAGETLELHPSRDFAQANLYLRVVRELDMIVPRHRARIRHRAECQEPSILPEIIFDLGVILRRNSRLDHQEARLRAELAENPASALAASNLGAILAQKQQFAEARQWLEKAYAMRYSLPDNGRRNYMLLNEVRRRQAKVNSATIPLAAHSTSTHQGHSVSVDGH
jgi:tetratricopeptide (TPR) repeat protein